MPVGFLGALVCGRPLHAAGFGLALTVVVECWQSLTHGGGEAADVLHNTAGPVLGAALAAVVLRTEKRQLFTPARRRR